MFELFSNVVGYINKQEGQELFEKRLNTVSKYMANKKDKNLYVR